MKLVMRLVFTLCLFYSLAHGLAQDSDYRIRTITAGVTVANLYDTTSLIEAAQFLVKAQQAYEMAGYEVQTIRIATQNLYEYIENGDYAGALEALEAFDRVAARFNIALAVGAIAPPDVLLDNLGDWSVKLINSTSTISFSLPICDLERGIYAKSIKSAASITRAISSGTEGGEGNFRFAATANCPPGTPFFPAAFHQGPNSFAIGLESPNILTRVFAEHRWEDTRNQLISAMEAELVPIEVLAQEIARVSGWGYGGIDTSPAPGLESSIGKAIESLTGEPFGGSSTLSACALITDAIKALKVKTCGYSGLMLPVIEDEVLARRATEGRFGVNELLLFSAVSGTGLDVVPLPGDTPVEVVERIFTDVASLALKYDAKALSARLFIIPGKKAGEIADFNNPYLTSCAVMSVD